MSENGVSGNPDEPVVPRDVRILHLILASQSIQSYEDHVPLQLMDFAHSEFERTRLPVNFILTLIPGSKITTDDIRLAIAARTNYQFKPVTPKELLLELAAERNKKTLPPIMPGYGIRLPPEKYCLTARDWSLSDEEDVSR
ncbi:Transcription initiation factor TFIID subunit 9 [Wickerhamomyces ciferrii]|uniref:Transcription initiation factor TFIID subunit 9 n=1 Tax=Wickerhamomyces ciferrii (strain ATCC 14091 / BCRC 22168 / CBS 111 / JCM 3599 / NBRC 0793 / NRRL Y-1031 F-60-10) TaxID=1206466 RepID=K0KLS6_WICCF|nr:Transcription initiation factor TFIID subunit 9 [Wickerhamomyces ciferrii]CCH43946.1 Transcription initiation factor TFIID subunit 9 [Wickerhamomyces ciferrii]